MEAPAEVGLMLRSAGAALLIVGALRAPADAEPPMMLAQSQGAAAPAAGAEFRVGRNRGDYRIVLDLAPQVIAVELDDDRKWSATSEGGPAEAELAATPAAVSRGTSFPSASILAHKAKQFDDGLYAAVELAAQNGLGDFRGKAALLRGLADRLSGAGDWSAAHDLVFGSAMLGGIVDESAEGARRARKRVEKFLKEPVRSKPISFYTWSPELSAIFQQDRFLQPTIEEGSARRLLAETLGADAALLDAYGRYNDLIVRLTNPLPPDYGDLRTTLAGAEPDSVCFFPPSRAPETELAKKLWKENDPTDEDLLDALIAAVRDGSVYLDPRLDSGWYDHQLWAYEPLIIPDRLPESRKLRVGARYRAELENLFRGLVALTRETHIKQLDVPTAGEGRIVRMAEVAPELSVEPLPTHYFRRALSYQFVRRVLVESFGHAALDSMHRLTPDGPREPSLAAELDQMEALYLGACATACGDLALSMSEVAGDIEPGVIASAIETFAAWKRTMAADPDLAEDSRMMVPLYAWPDGRVQVAALLGWTSRKLRASFATPPDIEVFDKTGRRLTADEVEVHLEGEAWEIAYPVVAEADVRALLDRNEFRTLCDSLRTQTAILAALN